MTKKVQVHLEDELVTELKIFALRQGKPVKDVIAEAIIKHLGRSETTNTEIPKVLNVEKVQVSNTKSIEVLNDTNTKILKEESTIPPTHTYPQEIDYDDPFADPDPMDERYFYILGKTDSTGPLEPHEVLSGVTNGTLRWAIPEGGLKHFDKNGNLIPFRYTNAYGDVFEPVQDQLDLIATKYGKPVTVEV